MMLCYHFGVNMHHNTVMPNTFYHRILSIATYFFQCRRYNNTQACCSMSTFQSSISLATAYLKNVYSNIQRSLPKTAKTSDKNRLTVCF